MLTKALGSWVMARSMKLWVVFLTVIALLSLAGVSSAASLKVVPSASQVGYDDTFSFDVIAEGIPTNGLGTVQFRLNVSALNSTVSGVADISLAKTGEISVVTPLLVGPFTANRSGMAGFFWNGKSSNGILVMDNETLQNGSGLYSFSHTNGASLPSGSGSIARFLVKAGTGVPADHVSVTLNDVALLNGDVVYPIDSTAGADVQLRCKTKMPSLLGLSYTNAINALTTAQLSAGTVYELDNSGGTLPLNVVLEQSVPAGNDVFCGAAINFAVNTPPTGGIVINEGAVSTNNQAVVLTLNCIDTLNGCSQMMFSNDNAIWSTPEIYGTAKNWQLSSGDGPKTVYVKYQDGVGNVSSAFSAGITLAMIPPVTTASPAGGIYRTGKTIVLITTEAGTIYYTTDGTMPTAASSVYSGPITIASSTTIKFFAVSSAGTIEQVKSETYTIDTVNPILALSTLPDGAYTNNAVLNVAGTATDNVAIQSVTINGTALTVNADGAFSLAITLATGTNSITTVVTDKAGNTTTDTRTITLDQTAPAITITSPADNSFTNALTTLVAGSVDKTVQNILVSTGTSTVSASVVNGVFSAPTITLAYGQNTIMILAMDLAGNTTNAKRTVTLDDANPSLAITIPNQDMGTNQTGVMLSGTVSDLTNVSLLVTCPTASVGVISTPTTTAWSVDITNMQQGTNTITVMATDQANNSTSVIRNIVYTTSPITIDPVTTPTNTNSQSVSGTVEENAAVTVSCPTALVGIVTYPSATTWQADLTLTTDGTYTITATATDSLGKVSSPVSATIILDTIAPTTAATLETGIYAPGLTVSLSTRDTGSTNDTATTYYTTDGSMPTTNSTVYTGGSITISATTTLNFFSVDLAGNIETPAKSATYMIDSTPPYGSISINNGAQYTSNTAVTLNLSCADPESGCSQMQFSNDNLTWSAQEPYASAKGWSLTSGDGSKIVYVKYINGVGLPSDSYPARITLDTTPPMTTASPSGGLYNKTQSIVLITNETATTYYTLDGTVPTKTSAVYSSPIIVSALTTTINFFSVDLAGNRETPVKSAAFTIDTIPPTLTLSTLPDGAYTNNDTLNIAGTATDNITLQGVTINDTAVTVNPDGAFSQVVTLATGTNTITTVATDKAANITKDERSITLDQTVPVITIMNPADNSVTNEINSMVTGTVDKTATVTVAVNGGIPAPAEMTGNFFSLPVTLVYGQNTIQATATDQAGNIGTAKRTVTLDNVNPALAITNPAQDIATNESSITLQGTVADLTGVAVTISFDGTVYAPSVTAGTFQQTLTFTARKTYAIVVTATDAVGNTTTVQRNVIYGAGCPSQIQSNFNGTAISGGNTIWFNGVVDVQGRNTAQTNTVILNNAKVRFSANGQAYELNIPASKIVFSPGAASATTVFENGKWVTTIPASYTGNVFLAGLAYQVPGAGLPGGINPVTWSGDFTADSPGLTVQWKWAAAVYTNFNADLTGVQVKPVDDNSISAFQNSDHAGTSENYKAYVTGGARGGGGSNYTGSYSGTTSASLQSCVVASP